MRLSFYGCTSGRDEGGFYCPLHLVEPRVFHVECRRVNLILCVSARRFQFAFAVVCEICMNYNKIN